VNSSTPETNPLYARSPIPKGWLEELKVYVSYNRLNEACDFTVMFLGQYGEEGTLVLGIPPNTTGFFKTTEGSEAPLEDTYAYLRVEAFGTFGQIYFSPMLKVRVVA